MRNLKLLRAHGEATAESRTPQWSAYPENLLHNLFSLSLLIREPITQLLIIIIAYQKTYYTIYLLASSNDNIAGPTSSTDHLGTTNRRVFVTKEDVSLWAMGMII